MTFKENLFSPEYVSGILLELGSDKWKILKADCLHLAS